MSDEPLMPNRESWLAERRTGLGGSDAAAACGLSKWKTRYRLWLEKRGLIADTVETEPMRWGTKLEPIVRQEYANRTGRTLITPGTMLRHPKHNVLLANVDGIVDGERRGYEGKTARSSDGWGDEGTNQIPDDYVCQTQHYMLVTGLPVFDVAVLIGGSDFRIYEVEADREIQEALLERELEFWRMVETGEEPEAESPDDTRARWPQSTTRSLVVPEHVVSIAVELAKVKAYKAQAEAAEALLAAQIQQHMQDAEAISLPGGKLLATWKSTKPRQSFDVESFKTEHPELYKAFLRTGESSRRFLLKELSA